MMLAVLRLRSLAKRNNKSVTKGAGGLADWSVAVKFVGRGSARLNIAGRPEFCHATSNIFIATAKPVPSDARTTARVPSLQTDHDAGVTGGGTIRNSGNRPCILAY